MRTPTIVGFVLIALSGTSSPAFALRQSTGTRPDLPESVATLPAGVVQLEMGSTYGQQNEMRSLSTGEAVIRAGLLPRLELQIAPASYMMQISPSERQLGLQDSGVGLKFALRQIGTGSPAYLPALALSIGASLPTGHADFRSRHGLPRARLFASWNFSSRANFTGDVGWTREEVAGVLVDEWNSTANLGLTVSDRASIYSEYINAGARLDTWGRGAVLTGGATYLLGPTVQLDVRAGIRTDASRGTFYHVGLARTF